LFVNAGSDAVRRFIEFFTANIRNRNTRAAYAFAVAASRGGVTRAASPWPN